MIFIIIYIYSYVYLCIYTPSYQHFKAFTVSKFDSETTFQRQFKVHSLKAIQHVSSGIHVYIYIYTISNQHFKAFTVSTVATSTGLCATCTHQETHISFCNWLALAQIPATYLSPCMECLNVSNTETKYTHAYLLDL